jgi:hypothetical protein
LKRLNKGNTLIDGCLSTTDPKESIFQWIRGNRGQREDMRGVDGELRQRPATRLSAAERAFSPHALTSCRETSWKPMMGAVQWYPERCDIYLTSSTGV